MFNYISNNPNRVLRLMKKFTSKMRFIDVHPNTKSLFFNTTTLPETKPNHKTVKVHSFGVNRADLLIKSGKYLTPYGMSPILGLECAGVDVETGRKVMGLTLGGAYSEYVNIHKDHLIEVPESIDFTTAGGLPEIYLTAYQLLRYLKKTDCLFEGSNVLVSGGASGVGTALTQLLSVIYKANVICSVGTSEKAIFCKSLGAAFTVIRTDSLKNSKIKDFLARNLDNTKLNGVLDHVGQNDFQSNIELLGIDGTIVCYSALSGAKTHIDLRDFLGRRANLFFTTLLPRSDDYKTKLTRDFIEEILPFFNTNFKEKSKNKGTFNSLKVVVHKVYDFSVEGIEEAHRTMESNTNIGKLIVKVC